MGRLIVCRWPEINLLHAGLTASYMRPQRCKADNAALMATLGYQIANPAAPSNVLMSPWPHGEQLFADFLSDASASRHLWACEYAVRALTHQRGVQKYR